MKRAAWIFVVLGIVCLGATAAQADWHHGYYAPYHHGPYHHGYCGPVVVRPPVVVARPMFVPVAPPPVVYGPAYPYGYYQPVPTGGVYIRGRGLSLGIGW